MQLSNNNFEGYVPKEIYQCKVRFLEMAIISPAWTNMMVYYIEGDHGHLMNEEVHKPKFRTRVQGAPISFQLPWEAILEDMQKNIDSADISHLPRSQESLKYFLRVHLNVQGIEMKSHLKHLRVRPWILLRLLSMLIDSRHEVFDGKGSAAQLKAKMYSRVHKEYPETESHVPEFERQGTIPASVLELINSYKSTEQSILQTKNATPGPGT